MNREIKFRSWDKQGNCMVDWSTMRQAAFNRGDAQLMYAMFTGRHDVELMQYTGLKDKSGKEIYEGDILRDDCNELNEVKFGKLPLDKSGDCVCTYEAFYCKCWGKLGQAPFYECAHIGDWMEVIGNIYENPELMEAKEDG